jgi:hypothetical protein
MAEGSGVRTGRPRPTRTKVHTDFTGRSPRLARVRRRERRFGAVRRPGRPVIVDCAAYRDGVRVASPTLDEAGDWCGAEDAFAWVGLRMPTSEEMGTACTVLGLEELDVTEALAPHDRPVLTGAGHAQWLVLRTAQYFDAREQIKLGELSAIFTERFVLTVRYGQASPLAGLRSTLEADPDRLRLGPPMVLAAIVNQVVEDPRSGTRCPPRTAAAPPQPGVLRRRGAGGDVGRPRPARPGGRSDPQPVRPRDHRRRRDAGPGVAAAERGHATHHRLGRDRRRPDAPGRDTA